MVAVTVIVPRFLGNVDDVCTLTRHVNKGHTMRTLKEGKFPNPHPDQYETNEDKQRLTKKSGVWSK